MRRSERCVSFSRPVVCFWPRCSPRPYCLWLPMHNRAETSWGQMSHLWRRVHPLGPNHPLGPWTESTDILQQMDFNKGHVPADTPFRTVSRSVMLSSLIHPSREGFPGCYEKRRQTHPSVVIGPSHCSSANKSPLKLVYVAFPCAVPSILMHLSPYMQKWKRVRVN